MVIGITVQYYRKYDIHVKITFFGYAITVLLHVLLSCYYFVQPIEAQEHPSILPMDILVPLLGHLIFSHRKKHMNK